MRSFNSCSLLYYSDTRLQGQSDVKVLSPASTSQHIQMVSGGVHVCISSSMLAYEDSPYAHLNIVCERSKYQILQNDPSITLNNQSPVKVDTTFDCYCIAIQMKCKCVVNPWLPLPSFGSGGNTFILKTVAYIFSV